MHSGNTTTTKSIGLTTSIGIASLILEGRSQCNDEDDVEDEQPPSINGNEPSSNYKLPLKSNSATHYGHDVNFLLSDSSSSSYPSPNQPGCSRSQTATVAEGTVQHIQRLRQKLMLIRSAPGTSLDAVTQAIAVSSGSTPYYTSSIDSDDDLDTVFSSPTTQTPKRDSNLLSTLRSLATNTCLNTTPRSFGRTQGLLRTVEAWTPSGVISLRNVALNATTSQATKSPNPPSKEKKTACLNVGSHCEEFMKKIGLIKSAKESSATLTSTPIRIKTSLDDVYVEEHICNESKINCLRWKVQCIRMETIYAHADPICIEVYLGPENHVILLEQWIIQRGERTNQMTMTLPSLCSAIRSQLHFSQISAWTEQLKSSTDPSAFCNNPRITVTPSVGCHQHIAKSKLDILYRIRPFDNTSCFSEKPIVHHFPDTIVADGQVVRVCLKSLPRSSSIPTLNMKLSQHIVGNEVSAMESSSSSVSIDTRMVLDDNETNNHNCTLYTNDVGSSSPVPEILMLTHRNRQLEKYKRRLQKRDQKKLKEVNVKMSIDCNTVMDSTISSGEPKFINSIRPPLYGSLLHREGLPPVEMKSIGTQTIDSFDHHHHKQKDAHAAGDDITSVYPNCDFCGIEMQYVCWNCDNKLFTPSSPVRSPLAPLDKANLLLQAIQRTPSVKQNAMMRNQNRLAAVSTTSTITTPTNSKSQTTRTSSGHTKWTLGESSQALSTASSTPMKSGTNSSSQPPCDNPVGLDLSDCRLCKRQKTKHNYFGNNNHTLLSNHNNNISNNNNYNNNVNVNFSLSSTGIAPKVACGVEIEQCRMSEGEDDVDAISAKDRLGQRAELANYHRRTMSESLDIGNSVQADPNSDLACRSAEHRRETVLSEMELKMYRRAYSEDVLTLGCDEISDDRMLHRPNELFLTHPMELSVDTVTPSECQSSSVQTTCSPSTSLSAMSLNSSSPYKFAQTVETRVSKPIPKVNLSRVFNASPRGIQSADDCRSSSEPFSFEHLVPGLGSTETNIGLVISAPSNDFIPVHKSNSAPSFPVPHSSGHMLSPRFLKQTAIQKRRSRHLSDRSSERSSIGSDEQFSDEELGCGLDNTYVAILSPINGQREVLRKTFPKSYPFGKKALLGSIEESLLQRRFVPKSHVPGFKVLLSASGGFYPTQLTIPSAASFYELHGQSLNTPYMCEIRMPRKGYSIPRKGTVQATLLNPHGMVVRMFVVPYDFRDMPILHHTFVRQRVLSDNRVVGDASKLSTTEQMKLLRYAIHLRFQTSRSGRLSLHSDIRMIISRRTDCDTAAAHMKGVLEQPSELQTVTVMPDSPKYSSRLDKI